MKSLICKLVAGLFLVSLLSAPAYAQGRIATVDLRKLFDNYWKTKQADAVLKNQAADVEKEFKTMLDDLKKSKEDYQTLLAEANNQTYSLDERERRKKTAEDKLKRIKEEEDAITQYDRRARTTLDEQTKRMRGSLVEEIRTAIKGKATDAGYALVLDTASEGANGTPIVLYTNNENDITDAVLAQINIGAPAAEAPKSDEKASGLNLKDDKKKDKK
ncbi:MAG TPA: OmpH family outer membrane protein [Candidatus Paceibacterota bacterium]|nr:OmpH family outer membrane protein [Verrucomicrobiota bacterium]HSA10207.1 OmpH family outer membrane protein [Candidatus Paceibacterota bacterium]